MWSRSPLLWHHLPHHGPSPRIIAIPQTPTTRFLKPLPSKRRAILTVGSAKAPSSTNGEPEVGPSEGSSSLDLLGLKREVETDDDDDDEEGGDVGGFEEELPLPGVSGRRGVVDFSDDEEEEERGRIVRRMSASGRQMVRRSSLLAKQVISARSACGLGFVSQIWVDTGPWLVVVLETKPSILSAESEKFLLEDVCQVGDVILIEDETVAEHEVNMAGLDTLVEYNVVTTDRYNVGKVRDFNFNINSGAVESLELDPFGLPIIPASLVSTYSLLVEDILEIKSDKIVVHDGAVSRMQRLSKETQENSAFSLFLSLKCIYPPPCVSAFLVVLQIA